MSFLKKIHDDDGFLILGYIRILPIIIAIFLAFLVVLMEVTLSNVVDNDLPINHREEFGCVVCCFQETLPFLS